MLWKKFKNRLDTFDSKRSILIMLLQLFKQLSKKRKFQIFCSILIMIFSAIAEVFSLASVVPFLLVLTDPERLWKIKSLKFFLNNIGIYQSNDLLIPFTVIFGLAATSAALIRIFNLWINGRLAAGIGYDLSQETFKRTLYQPYSFHVNLNSSKVITACTVQLNKVVAVINLSLQFATSLIVSFGLIIALLVVDTLIAGIAAGLITFSYALIVLLTKRKLKNNSQIISEASKMQVKILQEGLGSIRDVLLDGSQLIFLNNYKRNDFPLRIKEAQSRFLNVFPRYALEGAGILIIASLALILMLKNQSSSSVITLLGTLALGSQRLLPAVQLSYSCWSAIQSCSADIYSVIDLLNQEIPKTSQIGKKINPINFDKINLKNISFSYAEDNLNLIINNLDFDISKGERVGIIGKTGSGKSTFIDILMGLLIPFKGEITLNNKNLYSEDNEDLILQWRATIAHVPQNIYLTDNSIEENIAISSLGEVNTDLVKFVSKQAQIDHFIESLPNKYKTKIGERGIRLSGGQRQRIGIARALYKQAQVLVFDEATSALDNKTENELIKSIQSLDKNITILMIAHRYSTLKECDRILKMNNGFITDEFKPSDLPNILKNEFN